MNNIYATANLNIAWVKYLSFETHIRGKDGDILTFIREWEERKREAQSAGCQYSDLVLGLKLIEKANLDNDFSQLILSKLVLDENKSILPEIITQIKNISNISKWKEEPPWPNGEKNLGMGVKESIEDLPTFTNFDDSIEAFNKTIENEFISNQTKERSVIDYVQNTKAEYSCNQCSLEFKSKAKWERHLFIHENSFQCSKCDKSFITKNVLLIHLKRCQPGAALDSDEESDDKALSNEIKGEFVDEGTNNIKQASDDFALMKAVGSSSKIKFKKMRNTKKVQKENLSSLDKNSNKISPCEVCGKLLKESSMNDHLGTHNPKFKCGICNKLMSTKARLKTHSEIHVARRDFICPFCGKTYKTKLVYDVHVNTHTKAKSYVCSWCDKQFFQRNSWKLHVRSQHTGEDAHQCDVCYKKFFTATKLKEHKRTHTGEKPYKCEYCGKNFGDRNTYKRHTRRIHSKLTDQTVAVKDASFKYK